MDMKSMVTHGCLSMIMLLLHTGCVRVENEPRARWRTLPSESEILDARSGYYMSGWKIYDPRVEQWKKIGVWHIYFKGNNDLVGVTMYHDDQKMGLEWHYYEARPSAWGANFNGAAIGLGMIWDDQQTVSVAGLFSPSQPFIRLAENQTFDAILGEWSQHISEILAGYKRRHTPQDEYSTSCN